MVDFATVWSSSPAIFHIDLVARGFGDMAMLAHPDIHRNGYTVSWSSSRLRERIESQRTIVSFADADAGFDSSPENSQDMISGHVR